MNEINLALLYRQQELEGRVRRREQAERPALRTTSGPPYPEGGPGQGLFNFLTGDFYYWNSTRWATWSKRALALTGSGAAEFILPLPAVVTLVAAVEFAFDLAVPATGTDYYTFTFTTAAGALLTHVVNSAPAGPGVARLAPGTQLPSNANYIKLVVTAAGAIAGGYGVTILLRDIIVP